jgi:putative flippase GtrA
MHPSQLQEVRDTSPQTQQGRSPLRALLVEPTNNTLVQFIRYTLVGGAAFAADFTTLFLLIHFAKIYYLASAAVAFTIGLIINYAMSAAWVFAHRTMRNRTVEFGIFAAVGVIGLGLNELGMWLLSGRWGIHYLWAKLFTAALVYIWNFGARKVALFR